MPNENNNGGIDRFELGSYGLETNVVCLSGESASAESLSAVGLCPNNEDEGTPEQTVVICVSR